MLVLKKPSGNQVIPVAFFVLLDTTTPMQTPMISMAKTPIVTFQKFVGVSPCPAGGIAVETPPTRCIGNDEDSAFDTADAAKKSAACGAEKVQLFTADSFKFYCATCANTISNEHILLLHPRNIQYSPSPSICDYPTRGTPQRHSNSHYYSTNKSSACHRVLSREP